MASPLWPLIFTMLLHYFRGCYGGIGQTRNFHPFTLSYSRKYMSYFRNQVDLEREIIAYYFDCRYNESPAKNTIKPIMDQAVSALCGTS